MCSNIENFGEWLDEQMRLQGFTYAHLSRVSGVHPNTIRNYTQGKCEPTLYNAKCLAKALGYEIGVYKVWY